MTPSMWLTLVAAIGMATLAVTVVRARHPLAAPLGVLIATMLIWNLGWLAYVLSDDDRWRWLCQCAASIVPLAGLEFVLMFVGRSRALPGVRRVAYAYFLVAAGSCASRLVLQGDQLYPGDRWWGSWVVAGSAVLVVGVGWLLAQHHQRHRHGGGHERAHTRLIMVGLLLWTLLAATDLLHQRIERVPQMSGIGMLACVVLMALVMDRVRPDGPSRWWTTFTVVLFLATMVSQVVVFRALPVTTAMLLLRTVILVAVAGAAAREGVVIITRRRERLAELALIGRVTAQMAHDLKNPLAAIRAAAQVMAEDRCRGEGDTLRSERMLALIIQQTARLTRIVDDYQRIGRMEPHPREVTLADVVSRVAPPTNVTLDVRLQHTLACWIDPELLARALDNIVRNASEAMPKGGRVTIRTLPVDDDWVDVSVEDEGAGMDARQCERAFDDFFTTKPTGSGLGLAFVRRVAEAHGGHARLSSEVGRGTCLVVRVPRAPTVDPFVSAPFMPRPDRFEVIR